MNTQRLKLPLSIFVPAEWKIKQSAFIYTPDLRVLGRIEHDRIFLKKIFNRPVFTVDVAKFYPAKSDEPIYTITLPMSLSFEVKGHNGDIQGFIQPKTVSILPEFVFVDLRNIKMGTIRPSLQSVKIIEGDKLIKGRYSKVRSKGLSPRQHVWEYNSEDVTDIDSRLILGHACMPLAPDISNG